MKHHLAFFNSHGNPADLVVIAALASVYGLYLIKRGIEGDTLMPGTTFTYLPRWLFIVAGLLLQVLLPATSGLLKYLKHLWEP